MEENKLFIKLNIQRFATHLQTWSTYYKISGTGSASAGGDIKGMFAVYLESQNTADNSSYIRIVHQIVPGRVNGYAYEGKSTNIRTQARASNVSNGGTYQYSAYRNGNFGTSTVTAATTYHTVYHDSSGTATLYVNGALTGTFAGYNSGSSSTSRNFSFNVGLPTIPRYANISSFSIWQTGLNSIGGSVRADRAVDQIQYSLNGGSWTNCNQDFSITGLSPNTQYNVRTRVKSTASQLWTTSGYAYATTTQINQITSANPSGNSDNELKVTANNPSGNRNDIKLEFPDLGLIEILRINSTLSATFTAEQMENLANLIPDRNSTKLRATAVTVVGGTERYWHYKDGTYTVLNANPTFSTFDYADTNTVTVGLTGNSQTIIKGYSNLRARISSANKMIANKGATPKEYQLVVGAKQIKANYSSSADVDLSLNAIDNNVFIVYAIDSRGNSTPVQKSPTTYIDYFKPVIAFMGYEREGEIGTETTLKFNGSFFNENFGSQTNTISATYRYKRTNDNTWINGVTPLVLVTDGNNYSCDQLIAGDLGANGFDAKNSYDIEVIVKDKLESTPAQDVINTGKPNMAFAKDGIAINSLYDETKGSGLQISGNKIMFNGITLFEWVDE